LEVVLSLIVFLMKLLPHQQLKLGDTSAMRERRCQDIGEKKYLLIKFVTSASHQEANLLKRVFTDTFLTSYQHERN